MTVRSVLAPAVVLAFTASLAGCASPPAPEAGRALSEANYAIEEAARSVQRPEQSLPLYRARQKLEKARQIRATEEDDPMAQWLAEQAVLDARFAQAHTRAEHARQRLEEMQRSFEELRLELQRAEGAETQGVEP